MKHLTENWQRRSVFLLIISCIVMFGFYLLEWSDWAQQINANPSDSHGEAGEGLSPPAILLYVLPFVKQAVFIIVPASVTVVILALIRRFATRSNERSASNR